MLSPDSWLMRGMADVVDAIWINVLMVVTSIPLVTIGASVTAGYDAARRSLDGEGHVTANYFRAFRDNVVAATLLWLPFLAVGAGLAYAWVVLQITPLLVPKFGLTILWVIGFEWVFVLQARFENDVLHTLANAYVFGVTNVVSTLAVVVIDVVFVVLVVASVIYLPGGAPLLLILGYGAVLMLHVPIMERALRRYR
ncbi:beta-carotene 15,15'-monooxygenase [Bifidobacterium ramosum]|nr:beta-carotene 15,15'-monooxygenase [Bifidobacterium ramosum]